MDLRFPTRRRSEFSRLTGAVKRWHRACFRSTAVTNFALRMKNPIALIVDNRNAAPEGRSAAKPSRPQDGSPARAARRLASAIEPPAPVRSKLPALTRNMTVAGAAHLILRSCHDHLLANRQPVLKSDDPEAIHQARVALRRLRSALSLFRGPLNGADIDLIAAEAKWLAAEMGPARDMDVFIAELLEPAGRALANENGFTFYRAIALELQTDRRLRARKALRSRRFVAFRNALENRLARDIAPTRALAAASALPGQEQAADIGLLYQPIGEFAAELLARRDRRVRKRGRHLLRMEPAERHDLRIAVKKLRYAAEFFRSAFAGRKADNYADRLARLQNVLGDLNDIAAARPLMLEIERRLDPARQADGRFVNGVITGWHAVRAEGMEAGLRKAWKRFAATDGFWD